MTTTLTQQNEQLIDAIATATQRLCDESSKQYSAARDVRAILYDIAVDAMMPLPVSLQVLLPQDNLAIVGEATLQSIRDGLKEFEVTLR